jgi:polysaccharide export outer membrane protein
MRLALYIATRYALCVSIYPKDKMRKITFYFVAVASAIFLISPTIVYAQAGKDDLSKREAQGEIGADSNQYVIGPEDVLYIHTWKEEALSRTVPVRMDGKISVPLIDEVQAAGLTPLQLKEILVEKSKKFIDNPDVSVIVMEANSFKVYITPLPLGSDQAKQLKIYNKAIQRRVVLGLRRAFLTLKIGV